MKTFLVALFFISIAFAIQVTEMQNAIEDEYILVFNEKSTKQERDAHMESLQALFANDAFDNKIIAVYDFESFFGFAAKLSSTLIQKETTSDLFTIIEQNAEVRVAQSCSTQSNAVWGLDRIADTVVDLDGIYTYPSTAGSGVDAYIVDTGILTTHNDFGGRALWGANFVDSNNADCNGHGTHVAGTVGGTTYGVAKKVTLLAVKVLNCAGSGTNAGVINGVNWVVTSFKSRKNPSVANMSLGGGFSSALNTAVANAVSGGVAFAVAAGNENNDACNSSPASTPSAITVGATGTDEEDFSQVDNRAYFSNYGKCVSIWAPGLLIQSAWIGSNSATLTISGTSMASPHVCGIAAVFLAQNKNATPAEIKSWLIAQASANLIRLECEGATSQTACNQSPNEMAHSPC